MTKPLHAEYSSLHDLAQAVQKKQLDLIELANSATKHCLETQSYNVFNHVDPEFSQKQAELTQQTNTNESNILGAIIAHEDRIVTKDFRTSASSKILENYTSPFDGTVATNLKNAGAICIGKTNCDEFGLGTNGNSSINGPALNPWNKNHSAGASAGAGAVALKSVMAATAVDTVGNARISSAWCGVSSIKPSYGVVSRYGVVASGSSIESVSVIANNALDLLSILEPISEFDTKDNTSLEKCNQDQNLGLRIRQSFDAYKSKFSDNSKPLTGLNIGILEDLNQAADDGTKTCFDTAIKQLTDLGADITSISIENAELSANTAFLLHSAEAATGLARYDGVHFGYRAADYTDIHDLIAKSRTQGFGTSTKERIMFGNYVLSHDQYEDFYLQAQRIRAVISANLQKAFDKCDVILSPTTISTADAIDINNSFDNDIKNSHFTAIANLTGTPAISIPMGLSQGLPVGMQIIAQHFQEGQLLAIAHIFQNATTWHQHNLELK